MLDNGNDGLIQQWNYNTIFVNCPYGKGWYFLDDNGKRNYIWPADRRQMQDLLDNASTDPASHPNIDVKALRKLLKSLVQVNIGTWIERCADAGEAGSSVIGLIPAYPGTKAWHKDVWPRAKAVCFPKGRLHFRLVSIHTMPDGTTRLVENNGPAPMDVALLLWGDKHIAEFKDVFDSIGKVVLL